MNVKDMFGRGGITAASGTAIAILMQAKAKLKAWVTLLDYSTGATAHTLVIMKSLGKTTLASAAAASQAVINLASDPSLGTDQTPLATGQYVVLEQADGSPQIVGVISSVSSLAVTLTANLASAIPAGKRVWFFGLPTASDHNTYPVGTSTDKTIGSDLTVAGIAGADRADEPVIVYSPNTTNAGTFNRVQGVYSDTGRVA